MAVIHTETLRLVRYDEMTFQEIMERVNYCHKMQRLTWDKQKKRKWMLTACWLCEIAAKNMGALPKD